MVDLADHAGDGRPVILRDIARRQHVSKRYLEQLATLLRNANLFSSTSGRGGGYRLPRPAGQIRVGEIVSAISGELNIVDCVLRPDICSRSERCPSRSMWCRVNEQISDIFNNYSLDDLSEQGLESLPPCTTDRPMKAVACERAEP